MASTRIRIMPGSAVRPQDGDFFDFTVPLVFDEGVRCGLGYLRVYLDGSAGLYFVSSCNMWMNDKSFYRMLQAEPSVLLHMGGSSKFFQPPVWAIYGWLWRPDPPVVFKRQTETCDKARCLICNHRYRVQEK